MKFLWTRFLPVYPNVILYMLQNSEFNIVEYVGWLRRVDDVRQVMKRRTLEPTQKIKLLRLALLAIFGVNLFLAIYSFTQGDSGIFIGIALLLVTPWVAAYGIVIPLWVGKVMIQKPKERQLIQRAHKILANHPADKIAIAGSYGKTTAKEILSAVLSEGKKVAATPGNMNTPVGISRFVEQLNGNEEILIFELGESRVGDVKELCELIRPDIGIITGISEAHLSTFGTLKRTISTIFELQDFLEKKPLYVNEESPLVKGHLSQSDRTIRFGHHGVANWSVSAVEMNIEGTSFCIQKSNEVIWAHTRILGKQSLGIMSVAVAVADFYGFEGSRIAAGLKKVKPFEHRMQPRRLHGAWVIDDTYNGNSEGVKAGLALLKELSAKRRVYVTPGLVEQGHKTEEIHVEIGRQVGRIADVVVLMQNSVTDYIATGLQEVKYKGQLLLIDNPLDFYTHLDQFVAAGDIVLMQNDWTDNYS